MSIWLNSIYEVAGLIFALAGFVFLAQKNIKKGIILVVFLLPLYLVRVNFFFLPLNVLEILIWLIFIIWLVQGGHKNIRLVQIRQFLCPALLILVGATLSVLFSDDLRISAGILKGWFITPMILALIMISELKDEEGVKKILAALFGSASLVGVVSILYLLAGRLTFDGRLSAFYLSPNHLAMFLAPGFLIGLCFLKMAESKKSKIIIFIGLAVLAAALYSTFSYAAWPSILIVISVKCLVISYKKSRKLFILYCLMVTVLLAILFFSQLHSEKLNNLLFSVRSSWQSRLMIWHSAWLIGRDQPIFGIGPGMFQEYYLKYQARFSLPYLEWAAPQPHNLFLAFWLQTGLLGLIGFLWLLFKFFRKTIVLWQKQKQPLFLALTAVMVYILLHGLVDTTYWKNDLAVVFWLVIALAVSVMRIKTDQSHNENL